MGGLRTTAEPADSRYLTVDQSHHPGRHSLTPVLTPLTCASALGVSIFTPKSKVSEEATLGTRAKTQRSGPMALPNVMEAPAAGFNFDNSARYELLFTFRAEERNNIHGKTNACRVLAVFPGSKVKVFSLLLQRPTNAPVGSIGGDYAPK